MLTDVNLNFAQLIGIGLTLAAGSLLQSSVGFGFGLLVMPLLLLLADLSVPNAIGLMAAAALLQALISVYHLKRHADWRLLIPLILVGAVFLLLGVYMLHYMEGLDRDIVKQIVGSIQMVILILFWSWKVRLREHIHPFWGVIAVSLGGLVSGFVGMGGPFIVLWVMAHSWSNQKTRVTTLAIFAAMIPFQIAFLAWQFGAQVLHFSILGLLFVPMVLASTAGGLWIGSKISKARLRQLAMGLLFLIAAVSISQPLIN
jgi:uncharacterized membrane protein YfcA